ncbi:TIM barrel protein, partial [Candidatus Woesearchaeota archaeon]|nr:TIM barrel protein [Candidatus Woesearchaeota archaeon]
DKKKIEASKSRIMTSCERGHYLGANVVVFHAGFYQKKTKEETYNIINEALVDLQKRIKEKGWKVKLAPETTGKRSQFGNIDELLQLRKDIRTELCVDFAHLKAREGKIDYDEIFAKIKKAKIPHLHCHYSGIEYGEKGEKRHLVMKDKDIKELLKAVIKHKQDCTIISESPVTWKDSLKMKMILDTLR